MAFNTVKLPAVGRLRLKGDGTHTESIFLLLAKRTSPFKSAGASVQSTTGSRGLRISGSNAGYTTFRGSVKSTGYPLHSPVSPPVRHRVPSHFKWTLLLTTFPKLLFPIIFFFTFFYPSFFLPSLYPFFSLSRFPLFSSFLNLFSTLYYFSFSLSFLLLLSPIFNGTCSSCGPE